MTFGATRIAEPETIVETFGAASRMVFVVGTVLCRTRGVRATSKTGTCSKAAEITNKERAYSLAGFTVISTFSLDGKVSLIAGVDTELLVMTGDEET